MDAAWGGAAYRARRAVRSTQDLRERFDLPPDLSKDLFPAADGIDDLTALRLRSGDFVIGLAQLLVKFPALELETILGALGARQSLLCVDIQDERELRPRLTNHQPFQEKDQMSVHGAGCTLI